jgi:hypothetical protein
LRASFKLPRSAADNSFYGLSEIAFEGTIVPEPGSALLLGIATSGLLSRRRR